MSNANVGAVERLVIDTLGPQGGAKALGALSIDAALLAETGETVSRAAFAMALNVLLFDRR